MPAADLPTLCPACGRTTATVGRGRCANCAHAKLVRPTAADRPPRETWPDLLRLGGRKALRAALLLIALSAATAFVVAALLTDVLAAFAVTSALILLAVAVGAATG